MTAQLIKHTIAPIYDENSKILILGTMPSPKSRQMGFYYSHPQNKFWPILAEILKQADIPRETGEKIAFLKKHRIALWDVLKSCEITLADDNSIKNPAANDLRPILECSKIRAVFTTGLKATSLYQKYCFPYTNIKSIYLPSTSPANCKQHKTLAENYRIILRFL